MPVRRFKSRALSSFRTRPSIRTLLLGAIPPGLLSSEVWGCECGKDLRAQSLVARTTPNHDGALVRPICVVYGPADRGIFLRLFVPRHAVTSEPISKLLSFVLRHQPESVGLRLDAGGWVDLDILVAALATRDRSITRSVVIEVVRTSDKQRFALSPDGARIRASHGHSRTVALDYQPAAPPDTLFHGTVARSLPSIRRDGLTPRRRQHVHLARTADDARAVGARRGAPVVLEIRAADMAAAGHVFLRAPNGIWLTDAVPPAFIRFPE